MSLKHFSAPSPSSPSKQNTGSALPCRPWSREDYFDRLKTFSPFLWPLRAPMLRPPECARFGWICSARFTLLCQSCQATIITAPPPKSRDLDDASARAYHAKLETMHADSCPWRKLKCAETIYSVPKLSPFVAKELLSERIDLLLPIRDSLPLVKKSPDTQELLGTLKLMFDVKLRPCSNEETDRILALALYGWQPEKINDQHLVICGFCQRRVALWRFQPETEMNPLREHRWFCLWIYRDTKQPPVYEQLMDNLQTTHKE